MKVTCSAAKVRAKFDVLGENHGQEILDLQKKMSSEEEVVLEHTRKVVAITGSCSSNEHPCTQRRPEMRLLFAGYLYMGHRRFLIEHDAQP